VRFYQLRQDYFHHIIQVFHLADFDRGAMCLVILPDGGGIGLAPVGGDLLGDTMAADRLREKAERGFGISIFCEQKVNGLPGLIEGAIQIAPLPFDANVRLVHPPAAPHGPSTAVKRFLQLRAILQDPPVDGGVIHGDSPFLHQFFDVTRTQRIRHIPPHARENDLLWEMRTLEVHRHHLSPSLISRHDRGRAYPKSSQMKICDIYGPAVNVKVYAGSACIGTDAVIYAAS
jgi:hypothetical protein